VKMVKGKRINLC